MDAVTFGSPSSPGVPKDLTKHTLLAEYNSIDSVKRCFESSQDIACVIIEPIAGNMGLVPAEKEFLKQLRALCDEHKTLLIFDEVMSGFRASLKGAFGVVNIKLTIVTFGKSNWWAGMACKELLGGQINTTDYLVPKL